MNSGLGLLGRLSMLSLIGVAACSARAADVATVQTTATGSAGQTVSTNTTTAGTSSPGSTGTSSNAFPASVVSAKLQSIFALSLSKPGPNCPSGFKTLPANAGSLPSGVTYGVNGVAFVNVNSTSADISLDCWDFSGRTVYIYGTTNPHQITFTNIKFYNPNYATIFVGEASGNNPISNCNATITISNSDFDGRLTSGSVGNGQNVHQYCPILHITSSTFHDYQKDIFDAITSDIEIDHSFIEGCCQGLNNSALATSAHGESFHPTTGTINIHDNFWDFSKLKNVNAATTGSGFTAAIVYWESRNPGNNLIGIFKNNIIYGTTAGNSTYNALNKGFFQTASGTGAKSTVTYDNNVIQTTKAFVNGIEAYTAPAVRVDNRNNRDYDTNSIFALP